MVGYAVGATQGQERGVRDRVEVCAREKAIKGQTRAAAAVTLQRGVSESGQRQERSKKSKRDASLTNSVI